MATTKKDISLVMDSETGNEEAPTRPSSPAGLRFSRYFTVEGQSPYDAIEWEIRDAVITDEQSEVAARESAIALEHVDARHDLAGFPVAVVFLREAGIPGEQRGDRDAEFLVHCSFPFIVHSPKFRRLGYAIDDTAGSVSRQFVNLVLKSGLLPG